MSTLQEVTNQLMKSVKELADWEYPLSEILEKYYCLLENPAEINYGEAALIVQNSVDVYTKRVDYLDKEVFSLCQSFLEHEAQEEIAKSKSKERKSRKTVIDFDNFELLDFKKEMGKNINMKNHTQKPVKLLNRRFTQLETSAAQVRFPIEVFDIHGEAVGKKYDFRCNQQMTISGMLVDECMPSDFNQPNLLAFNSEESNVRFDSSLLNDSIPDRTSPERADSTLILPDGTTENCTSQEDCGYFSLSINSEQITSTINESSKMDSLDFENTTKVNGTLNSSEEFSETVEKNLDDSQRNAESNLEMDCTGEGIADEPVHIDDDLVDQENHNEEEENHEDSENMKNSAEAPNSLKESPVSENQPEAVVNGNHQSEVGEIQPEVDNNQPEEEEDDENGVGNCKETDSGYRSGESEDYEIPRRRSKRMKNMVCVVNDMNKNVWKPIPFDQGIPEKLPKSRTKFKLPCHISLLKSKCSSRKRKILTEQRKTESLPKFLLNETESPMKKMNMYSPSRPAFMPLKIEELLDFQKSFEDCFKGRQCCDVFHYEAATTITMDLLGFFPSFTKQDPLSNSPFKTIAQTPEHVSASCSDPGFSPRPTSPGIVIFDANTPPDSPEMADDTFDAEEALHSTLNYQQLIECRMREICEEFDVRTDLEQNVARWHEAIKPKLQEAERRPPFHIREYGDRVVAKLAETTERRIAFEDVILDQSPAEVARLFSATLQLANSYNLGIETDDENRNIKLILLSNDNTQREISYETPKSSKLEKPKKFRHIT